MKNIKNFYYKYGKFKNAIKLINVIYKIESFINPKINAQRMECKYIKKKLIENFKCPYFQINFFKIKYTFYNL